MSLVGPYECTLDNKNRLMIPADFRRELEQAKGSLRWYVTLHVEDRLRLTPEDEFNRQLEGLESTLLPKDEQMEFSRMLCGRSRLVTPDTQGRIVLPDQFVARAGLSREVMVVGVGRHAEVHDRQKWQGELDKGDFNALFRKARAAGIMKGGSPGGQPGST